MWQIRVDPAEGPYRAEAPRKTRIGASDEDPANDLDRLATEMGAAPISMAGFARNARSVRADFEGDRGLTFRSSSVLP
jgi:hypothetical protein